MANREIGSAVLGGWVFLWWAGFAGVGVWLTSNSAPGAPVLKWKEEPITTTTKIVAEIATPAPDADRATEIEYTYAWTLNGEARPDVVGNIVDSKLTTKGDVWEVTVEPNDGSKGGSLCFLPWRECAGKPEANAKLSVTIADSAPRARVLFRGADNIPTKLFDGKSDVTPEFGCADPDFSEANSAAAAKAKAAGQEPVDPATLPDPCTYGFKWYPITEPPQPADAPPAYEGRTVPGDVSAAMLPKDAWKKADAWKIVVVANDGEMDGVEVDETIRKG